MDAAKRVEIREAVIKLMIGAEKGTRDMVNLWMGVDECVEAGMVAADNLMPQATTEEKLAFTFGLLFSETMRHYNQPSNKDTNHKDIEELMKQVRMPA